ncbi:unnamed protein product [Prorocentrum cordatum]|uniref:Uncharacterized protein n=1 Tax=Prorocentrum cordatum TaxID=2364126 RepID=A0ABN9PQ84_9DINO|nr:unnamed protein product [Polarella glacialis]
MVGLALCIAAAWRQELFSSEPSIFVTAKGSIDYYIVSPVLSYQARVEVIVHWGAPPPHFPVLLALGAIANANMQYHIARVPKRFPMDAPVGCGRADPRTRWGHATAMMHAIDIDATWRLWLASAGMDWADVCGLSPADNSEYFGRRELPALSPVAVWRFAARCFEGLARWLPPPLRAGTLRLARQVQRRFKASRVIEFLARPWLVLLGVAAQLPIELAAAAATITKSLAVRAHRQAEQDKLAGWRSQARRHSLDGAAALHAYSRPAIPWHASSTSTADAGAAELVALPRGFQHALPGTVFNSDLPFVADDLYVRGQPSAKLISRLRGRHLRIQTRARTVAEVACCATPLHARWRKCHGVGHAAFFCRRHPPLCSVGAQELLRQERALGRCAEDLARRAEALARGEAAAERREEALLRRCEEVLARCGKREEDLERREDHGPWRCARRPWCCARRPWGSTRRCCGGARRRLPPPRRRWRPTTRPSGCRCAAQTRTRRAPRRAHLRHPEAVAAAAQPAPPAAPRTAAAARARTAHRRRSTRTTGSWWRTSRQSWTTRLAGASPFEEEKVRIPPPLPRFRLPSKKKKLPLGFPTPGPSRRHCSGATDVSGSRCASPKRLPPSWKLKV